MVSEMSVGRPYCYQCYAVLDVYLKDAVGMAMPSGQASFPWDYTGRDIVRSS